MADEFSYIGINADGLAVALCVDDPKFKKDTAKTVAAWIRMGRSIVRLPDHEAIARLKSDHAKRKQ